MNACIVLQEKDLLKHQLQGAYSIQKYLAIQKYAIACQPYTHHLQVILLTISRFCILHILKKRLVRASLLEISVILLHQMYPKTNAIHNRQQFYNKIYDYKLLLYGDVHILVLSYTSLLETHFQILVKTIHLYYTNELVNSMLVNVYQAYNLF